jgi:hypothetical protein
MNLNSIGCEDIDEDAQRAVNDLSSIFSFLRRWHCPEGRAILAWHACKSIERREKARGGTGTALPKMK